MTSHFNHKHLIQLQGCQTVCAFLKVKAGSGPLSIISSVSHAKLEQLAGIQVSTRMIRQNGKENKQGSKSYLKRSYMKCAAIFKKSLRVVICVTYPTHSFHSNEENSEEKKTKS